MEEIKKIEVQGQQYGVADMLMRSVMGGNAQVIEWSHTHNMNDYKEAGTYRIKGERTGNPLDDNLPIMNQGSGHTIEGILYVLDSSLANGSGKEDDCTITQFLMLSNRVGGQEGDMYMRSAYGVSKDNLTWKPWEKYQTNMEVGVVSDNHLLNPSNPTEILKKYSGMINLRDNGIYSGIYFGPKCMVGTGEDNWHISFQDATAIETFVMIVINNYAAASNARCITQIKFAVTNGGVFSMEKRSTSPESLYFSQWESVGSGSSNSLINKPNTFNSSSLVLDDVALNLKFSTYSGDWDIVAKKASLEFIDKKTDVQCIISREGLIIGTDTNGGYVAIGKEVKIGNNVTIGDRATMGPNVAIRDVVIQASAGEVIFSRSSESSQFVTFTINSDGTGMGLAKSGSTCCYMDKVIIRNNNTYLPWNVSDKGSELLVINASDEKITFAYKGKTAELPLT